MQRKTLISSALAATMACGALGTIVMAAAPTHEHHQQNLTRAQAQADAGKLFDRIDVNHDGKIDAADRTAHLDAMFDKLDTNHDGVISRDEFRAAHEHGPEMGMAMGRAGDHDRRHGDDAGAPPAGGPGRGQPHFGQVRRQGHDGWRGHQGHGMMLAGIIMHMADPNHSGSVSRDAFVGAALKLFDETDTNHDGVVTGEERAAERGRLAYRMRDAMRARWQAHHADGEKNANAPMPPVADNSGKRGS